MADPIQSLYLDSSATCPLKPGVVEAMTSVWSTAWGNPSSVHHEGLQAVEVLERARLRIADSFDAVPNDVIFTSGATESVHLAILGMAASLQPGRIVISAVEHPAVTAAAQALQRTGWEVTQWPVDSLGRIKLSELNRMLSPPTRLVSVIWGQSEVGTLQPIQTVGAACARQGIPFHTDATQVVGQGCPMWSKLSADLLSASAHKFGGPKGVGLLLTREGVRERLEPIHGGGGQEQGYRAGTQPVALIEGMAKALEQSTRWTPEDGPDDAGQHSSADANPTIRTSRDALLDQMLQDPRLILTGDPHWRLPHHISVMAHNSKGDPLSGRALVRELATHHISVSSGSACSSGKDSGSSVLAAMGMAPAQQRAGLRLTLGGWIQQHHHQQVVDALKESLNALDEAR